jgi:hypothetical protein
MSGLNEHAMRSDPNLLECPWVLKKVSFFGMKKGNDYERER